MTHTLHFMNGFSLSLVNCTLLTPLQCFSANHLSLVLGSRKVDDPKIQVKLSAELRYAV